MIQLQTSPAQSQTSDPSSPDFTVDLQRPAQLAQTFFGPRPVSVGLTERIVVTVGGTLLIALGVRQRSHLGAGMALIGAFLLHRGVTGYCPFYTGEGEPPITDESNTHDPDPVNEASRESFPASDPPSFNPGNA